MDEHTGDNSQVVVFTEPKLQELITQIFNCVNTRVSGSKVYSFEERQVGVWLDGKPLYEKTVQGVTPGEVRATVSYASIPDMDHMVSIKCSIYQGKRCQRSCPTAYASLQRDGDELFVWINDTTLLNKPIIATVEYTKTTDKPLYEINL